MLPLDWVITPHKGDCHVDQAIVKSLLQNSSLCKALCLQGRSDMHVHSSDRKAFICKSKFWHLNTCKRAWWFLPPKPDFAGMGHGISACWASGTRWQTIVIAPRTRANEGQRWIVRVKRKGAFHSRLLQCFCKIGLRQIITHLHMHLNKFFG